MSEHIKVSLYNNVQHIQICRLDKKNALTGAMYGAMAEALETSNTNEDINVNLIYGEPGCFTAGNDIKDFMHTAQTGDLDNSVVTFLVSLAKLEKPLILAIDGPAIGIGTTMAFHADLVYASSNGVFATPFVDLGLVPEAASSYLMPQRMGYAKAYEMLALGHPFSAEQAKESGFVNQILDDNLMEHCQQTAETLALKPQKALKITKRLMKGADKTVVEKTMQEEIEHFKNQLTSQEAKTAFFAFLNK